MKAPVLSDAQWEQVFASTEHMDRPEMYRLLMLLVRKLGLRPKELALMERSWFRIDNTLRIPQGSSKGNASRTLPVDAEILLALAEHLRGRTGRVFLNQMGQPFLPGGMSACIARCIQRAVGQGSAYSGRRGKSQQLLDAGANLLTIQSFLGHKSVLTTIHYLEPSQVQLREALFG